MNILIKLMSIVSLVLAPTLAGVWGTKKIVDHAAKPIIERSIISNSATVKPQTTIHLQ